MMHGQENIKSSSGSLQVVVAKVMNYEDKIYYIILYHFNN